MPISHIRSLLETTLARSRKECAESTCLQNMTKTENHGIFTLRGVSWLNWTDSKSSVSIIKINLFNSDINILSFWVLYADDIAVIVETEENCRKLKYWLSQGICKSFYNFGYEIIHAFSQNVDNKPIKFSISAAYHKHKTLKTKTRKETQIEFYKTTATSTCQYNPLLNQNQCL